MLKKIALVFVLVVVTLLSLLFYYGTDSTPDHQALKKQLKVSKLLVNPNRPLPQFSLIDHNGVVFDNDRLKNQWSLVFFGYTHCPDVCPTGLMDMAMLEQVLENEKIQVPKVVFITLDPKRDTPALLKTYLTHFSEDFLGVSGDTNQVNQLIRPFGTFYEFVMYSGDKQVVLGQSLPEGVEDYHVNHTAWIYLISPDGEIFAGFPTPHKPKDMAKDIQLIFNHQ